MRRAFEKIRRRLESEGRQAAMVGVTQGPLFGPLITGGLGGVLGDVCFRVTPLTDADAAEMVRSIRGIAHSRATSATQPRMWRPYLRRKVGLFGGLGERWSTWEVIMSTSRRRAIWLFLVLPLLVIGLGLLGLWGFRSILAVLVGPAPVRYDRPTQLAGVPVASLPNSLAWSADGHYLAAGTWGLSTGETAPGEVYVVDVEKASVATTLMAKTWVEGLAFSPDGKWLAVAARPSIPAGGMPAELVVFDVPAFTARFTARAGSPENGFIDLAWAADGKSLLAIDGPVDYAQGKAEVRRWDVPAFTEQPVVRAVQLRGPAALAVSPDGQTLALSSGEGETNALLVRVFDLGGGAERSFRAGNPYQPPRLGFTADGKAVGVFDMDQLSWWDAATGRSAEPGVAHFAVQPAGLSNHRSRASISPDVGWVARGYERHRGLGDLGWDNREMEFGGFVRVTERASEKTQTWRVSGAMDAPAVAFSPDGARLAGTVWQSSGAGLILIWAVPK